MDRRNFIRLSLSSGLVLAASGVSLFDTPELRWSSLEGFPGMPVRLELPESLGLPKEARLRIFGADALAVSELLYDNAVDAGAISWRLPAQPRALEEDERLLHAQLVMADGRVLAATRRTLCVRTRTFRFGL